jgi:hypothetical protein
MLRNAPCPALPFSLARCASDAPKFARRAGSLGGKNRRVQRWPRRAIQTDQNEQILLILGGEERFLQQPSKVEC